jgi:hypothetical protein
MALWPVVAESRKVVEGIYLVVTETPLQLTSGGIADAVGSVKGQKKSRRQRGRGDRPSTQPQPASGGRYLVLASTGDVIATGATSSPTPLGVIEGCAVRPDWHSYINDLASSSTQTVAPSTSTKIGPIADNSTRLSLVMSNVRTKDSFSAPSGISRAWISKVCPAADGQAQGTPEALQVAERAVLNSCVLNSFSGEKLSAVHMDAEWLGNGPDFTSSSTRSTTGLFAQASHAGLSTAVKASVTTAKSSGASSKVELYLPE